MRLDLAGEADTIGAASAPSELVAKSGPAARPQPSTLPQANSSISPAISPAKPLRTASIAVPPVEPQPHRRADGGVHARRRAAGVQHRQPAAPAGAATLGQRLGERARRSSPSR